MLSFGIRGPSGVERASLFSRHLEFHQSFIGVLPACTVTTSRCIGFIAGMSSSSNFGVAEVLIGQYFVVEVGECSFGCAVVAAGRDNGRILMTWTDKVE